MQFIMHFIKNSSVVLQQKKAQGNKCPIP